MASVSASAAPPRPAAEAEEARTVPAADRVMRRLLRVTTIERSPMIARSAHRGFQLSMVVSGLRCIITYLVLPLLGPMLGIAGVVTAPIGIALCVVAAISGTISLRRFWISDHKGKWMYTGFIAVVFLVLAISVVADITRLVTGA